MGLFLNITYNDNEGLTRVEECWRCVLREEEKREGRSISMAVDCRAIRTAVDLFVADADKETLFLSQFQPMDFYNQVLLTGLVKNYQDI